MPSQDKWDQLFLKLTLNIATMSKDPSTKVGSVIVSSDNRQISFGYNGFVRGIEETSEKWQRPHKYQYVQHSELNAILNCPFDTYGCKLYCTHQPCHRCLEMILQAGITKVYYINNYNNLEYKEIWDEHAKLFQEILQKDIVND